MASRNLCTACWNPNPTHARFCVQCGRPLVPPPADPPGGLRYSPLRFQVDPLDPPPRRDLRWTMIVVGFSLVVLGILLLVVATIVSTAVASGGASCGSGACPTPGPVSWFALLGFALLGAGLVLGAAGAWRALRTS